MNTPSHDLAKQVKLLNHGWEKYYKIRDLVAQTQAWVPYT